MTAYYDEAGKRLMDLEARWRATGEFPWREMNGWEQRLVWDVTVQSNLPGFPQAVRDMIDEAVLRYGVDSQPPIGEWSPHLDMEDERDHFRRLHNLAGAFHDAGHALAMLPGCEWSDGPISNMRRMFNPSDDRRWYAAAAVAIAYALAAAAGMP